MDTDADGDVKRATTPPLIPVGSSEMVDLHADLSLHPSYYSSNDVFERGRASFAIWGDGRGRGIATRVVDRQAAKGGQTQSKPRSSHASSPSSKTRWWPPSQIAEDITDRTSEQAGHITTFFRALAVCHTALADKPGQAEKLWHLELPQESAQRQRRELADLQSGQRKKPSRSGSLPKAFNINTYKFHALDDYEKAIRMFGTTDSYTTQVGERAHRLIK
ncbi:hypothetical protein OG21DRAFT_1500583 [Imleria badia]|nr:hypothetical protein OG21DRAFT_1500583 [Imleria badia]